MNKKKSKALAFLLAASLLVPSTNGIVSAAELKGGNIVAEESMLKEESYTVVKTEDELRTALNNGKKKIAIDADLELKNSVPINVEGVEITGSIKVENGISKNQTTIKGGGMFNINADNVVIERLNFDNTKEGSVGFEIGKNINTTIRLCEFSGKPIFNLIICDPTSSLEFRNNKVNMNARALIVGVSNGSLISNNEIDLKNEHYGSNDRSGVMSLKALESQSGDVTITENTFRNANRVIGVDYSNIDGKRIKIKNNKFIESRYALEVGTSANKGNNYDLSNNYFTHKDAGGVGALRIEDADSKSGSHFSYGESGTEIKLDDSTPVDIIVGPYYSSESNIGSTNVSHAGVATVNGKDYPTLEKAIKAAEEGDVVKLVSDITVDTWNQIWGIKGITLDGNEKTIKVTNKIESNQNHDSVLLSAGGNEFKNLIIDLSELKEGSKQQGVRAISAAEGDKIENVTIKGNEFVSYGIVADEQSKNLEVKGSNISNCKHGIYFATENNNVGENIRIDDNKFSDCEFAAILYPNKLYFINNELNNSSLNIVSDSVLVNHNIFDGNYKIEFYNSSEFRLNILRNPNNKIEFMGKNKNEIIDKMFMYPNYWGSENPNFNEIVIGGGLTEEQIETGFEPYYKDENRNELKGELHYINIASKGNGYTSTNPIYAKEGKKVIVELEPLAGWHLGTISSKDVVLKKESSSGKVLKYSFIMPNNDVNIKVEFKKNSSTSIPSKPSKPVYTHEKIEGLDRYETAGKVADELGSYDTAVLVNATSTMSDGLSAAGLAGKEDAAILLVKKDSIPKVTMDRLKKVKKVYIIGGENAISKKVSDEITKNVAKVEIERLGGKTRVETSELVAKEIGDYSNAFVVNGFKGEADAMSASPVAARYEAPILLTNGKTSNHAKKSGVKYYVVGGNDVVNNTIVDKYDAERLAGKDRYETNREVIDEFYSGSSKLYIANGDKLVDALTASPLAKNDGIVLVNEKSDKSILKDKNTVQVGGMNFEIEFEK